MKDKAKYSIWRRGYSQLKKVWRNHQWLIIGGFWIATFALGCVGTMKQLEVTEMFFPAVYKKPRGDLWPGEKGSVAGERIF